MRCPHCGTESKLGEHFCEECGAQLDSAGTVAPGNGAVPVPPAAGVVPGTSPQAETTEPPAMIAPGASLQMGRYVIAKALGEGGMGTVLLAKDTRLADKPTVVKVLSAEGDDTVKLQEDVRNFKREAETLAHLDHPLIPDVTDHFEEGTRYYMVMDYVEGESLEHWLDRTHQPMKEEDALRYGLEVLDILEYLSKQQPAIVHRDIKPANLIIGAKDKHIHLVDFGIARANITVSGRAHKTTALGTPGYAPPEQYQGYADPRSDLYALAATLHHMLTNRDPGEYAPFQFPSIRSLNPQLSPQLEQILIKALKTNASERYQTPQEMRRDLESLLAGTALLGTTDSYTVSGTLPPRVLAPQSPRRPTGAARPTRDSSESIARSGERARQQWQETGYNESDYYQSEQQTRFEEPRQIFEQRTFQEYEPYQRQEQYNYQRPMSQQDAENQLMWRFIIFVVAICAIGILAYFLFSSLHFGGF